MFDVAHKNGGSTIVLATSNDPTYPPENMIDGQDETFWTTTGLYPQEFIVAFGHTMDVQRITMSSYNVKDIQIEKSSSTSSDPSSFEPLDKRCLAQTDGQLQVEDYDVKCQATHLKFIVDAGYDHFFSVHTLNINGNAVRR